MINFRSIGLRGTVIAAAAMFAGCALGPDFVRPEPPSADRYTRAALPAATVSADGTAQQFAADAELGADWWRLFKSAQLDAIVGQAIAGNQTLQASEATLRQSQDNLRAGYGVFFPKIDADAAASRQRTAPLQEGLKTSSTIFNLVTLSGTISYPLDVFGGERRAVEGLRAQAYEQYYATKAAYLTLSANVVDASIARAAYAAEIRTTEQLIDLEMQQLQLAQAQVSAGTASFSIVLSVRSLVAANKALLAPLRQRVDQADDLLAALRGVVPSRANPPEVDLAGLTLPVLLPVSVPSDLVRQRPDILSAEEFLHAASANIGVATAAMFPSISLSATYGASGTSLGSLPAASGRFWSVGPSATVPIFQGGGLWYARKAAIDAFDAAQADYRQTVLAAFEQVADSLTALEHDAEALQAQVDAKQSAEENLSLVQANYRAGLVAFSDVLTADVQLHETTIGYLQAVAQRHQDTVALFVSLGGGWWNVRRPPPESMLQ
jgi:NodT family efflux transporter outer membrane factor (OMF) lipoprotein